MKFLVLGLGSMGKRRIRCLRALGYRDVVGIDLREDRRAEVARALEVPVRDSFAAALAEEGADAVIISTPPDHHDAPWRAALGAGKHVFCEAGIAAPALDLQGLADARGVVAAPSASMRFHPLYQHLHRLVCQEQALGRPLLLTFHLGNYILDWHPWEGLDFYAGRRATGACREMVPFELQWMRWVFGPVESVQCTAARQLDLPTDIDDSYAIVARFQSGLLATILIEVVARYPIRAGRLLSQSGQLSWDFDSNRVWQYEAEGRLFREHKAAGRGYDIEQMYVAEVDAFLRACRGEAPWPHTLADDRELGRTLLACERSHETGARVRVADVSP